MDIGLATRTMTKIVTGNARNPKRVTADMDQISLMVSPSHAKTQMGAMNMVVMANARDHMGMTVPQIVTRQSS